MELPHVLALLVPIFLAAAAAATTAARAAAARRTAAAYAGRHVLLTGGTSGIGKAAAAAAVASGARVTVVGRDGAKLAAAVAALRAVPVAASAAAAAASATAAAAAPASAPAGAGSPPPTPPVVGVSADVSTPAGAAAAVAAATAAHGPVDFAFCVAGAATARRFVETPGPDLDRQVAANLGTGLHTAHAAAVAMTGVTPPPAHPRRLVLVSSMAGLTGVYGMATYCAGKWGLRGLGEALYYELRPYGIGVTTVYPPDTATPGYEAENVGKPAETVAVSEGGGLWSPEAVAAGMLAGVAAGRERVTFGFEGGMLGGVTAGMAPRAGAEVFFGGVLRLVAQGYVWYWNGLIGRAHRARMAAAAATGGGGGAKKAQ
ncbi:hypothetical protein BU14_0065s0003 [Porphyra umbilicalis]|uniref:3-ketodihydrosphingosine reductase n=1 Tax=Porphyra umbilicalis TaxID=2786 RepID=A0A1X6PGV6_PORUM|nr:hypothetical protein BU14_0065s0003 [Porphyra umbilicalis]|eukprot:OSX79998.1 hypothetical protein BU14_0065s0003 [Porphyra umbilicalis]